MVLRYYSDQILQFFCSISYPCDQFQQQVAGLPIFFF